MVEEKLEKERNFLDVLKLFSPGTAIRTALDDILKARMGALIVIDSPGLMKLVEGGFRLNTKFNAQKLVELAKMDGAIILSKDMKKILYTNALLIPDVSFSTKETGTRHKAAERTAKQIDTITIAVSERKNKITLYYKKVMHELEESSEILRRATETLQILEKQKETFDDLLLGLNLSEVSDTVTLIDICGILQSIEVILRISDIVRRYLIELGKEGVIVSMRLKELTKNLSREKEFIFEDYFSSGKKSIDNDLKAINFDSLLDTVGLSKILFKNEGNKSVSPKGIRVLNKVNLNSDEINSLLSNFENLSDIMAADKEEILKILSNKGKVDSFFHDLANLKEKILMGKKI